MQDKIFVGSFGEIKGEKILRHLYNFIIKSAALVFKIVINRVAEEGEIIVVYKFSNY